MNELNGPCMSTNGNIEMNKMNSVPYKKTVAVATQLKTRRERKKKRDQTKETQHSRENQKKEKKGKKIYLFVQVYVLMVQSVV